MRYSMGLLRALVRNTPGSGWHWCPWAKPVNEETCRDACQVPYIVMTHAFVDMAVASKSMLDHSLFPRERKRKMACTGLGHAPQGLGEMSGGNQNLLCNN